MAILRIKDENGNIHDIAAIVGPPGPQGPPGPAGAGTGDMTESTYDPAGGRRQVAFDSDLAAVAKSGSYNDLTSKPTIPSAVTETTVSGWGFTKNTGTYSKPSTGIPETDLASAVQSSLGKADTALQSYTETDPVFSASAAKNITASDITNWNSKANASDIPDVPEWAMAETKPTYTASEVGARPSTWTPTASQVGAPTTTAFNNHVNSTTVHVTEAEKSAWNAKADASDIPAAVTESTVSGWGFTKNSGTYSKPSGGIPKTDLASAVQASLGKADTALQSYTETDPTVPSWAKTASKPSYTKSEVGLGNVDNVKQYSASNPPPYPVTSVNGQTGAVTVEGGGSTPVQYTASVAATWTQNSTTKLYSKSVTVTGLLATYDVAPDIDINLSGKNATDAAALMAAFANVTYATTAANSLTLYSTAQITVALPLIIRVFP